MVEKTAKTLRREAALAISNARTRDRRKAIAFLASKLGAGWQYRAWKKATPSNAELVESLRLQGQNISTLHGWSSENPDLPCPKRSKGSKPAPKVRPTKRLQSVSPPLIDVNSDDFLNSHEWRTLRYKALQLHGRRCLCCGANPQDGVTVLNVDHIKPRRNYPSLAMDLSNLQILCNHCNHGKGSWDQTDFREPKHA